MTRAQVRAGSGGSKCLKCCNSPSLNEEGRLENVMECPSRHGGHESSRPTPCDALQKGPARLRRPTPSAASSLFPPSPCPLHCACSVSYLRPAFYHDWFHEGMGISGLLPLLKDSQVRSLLSSQSERPLANPGSGLNPAKEEIHISKYKGKTLGVDAYVWLHRGAYGCAQQLALGQPTTRYDADKERETRQRGSLLMNLPL